MVVKVSAVFCPSITDLLFFCEQVPIIVLYAAGFWLSFLHEVVNYFECSFAVVLVDVIFCFTTLLFNPVFLASLQAPHYCIVNLSVLSSTFSGALVFLQLSLFIAHF